MPVPKELIDKIGEYESQGFKPEDIVEGLKQSKNFPDIAAKVNAFHQGGYAPDQIIMGLKNSSLNDTRTGLERYGSDVAKRVREDWKQMQASAPKIYNPIELGKYALSAIDVPWSPIGEAFQSPVKSLGEMGVISKETAEKVAPYAEVAGGLGIGLVKTGTTQLAKSLGMLGIGRPTETLNQQLVKAFTPVREKEVVKATLSRKMADVAQARDHLWTIAQERIPWWESLPENTRIGFMNMVEKGKTSTGEMIQAFGKEHGARMSDVAKEYRGRLDKAYSWAAKYDDNLHFVENYFPHIWEKPQDAEKFFSGYVSKLGKQQFQKMRTFDLIDEGMKAGLKLKTTNPEQLVFWRESAGLQHKMAKEFFQDMKDSNMLKAFSKGQMPKGWAEIKSPKIPPMVFGDEEVKAMKMMSNQLFNATERFKQALKNFKVGKPGVPGKEPTTDEILAIWRDLSGGDPELANYIKTLTDQQKVELAKFAMKGKVPEWFTFKTGGTPGEPGTDMAKLAKDFEDIQSGFKNISVADLEKHFRVLQRSWAMPEDAAKVVNRWLEPSLWSNPNWGGKAFRGAMAMKNIRTSIILGVNAFHGFNTSMSDVASRASLGLEQMSRGEIKNGLETMAKAPASPFISAYKGGDYIKAWNLMGEGEEALAKLKAANVSDAAIEGVELLKRGGARVQFAEQFGPDSAMRMAFNDLKNDNYFQGSKKIVTTLTEALAKPILGWYVPRLKVNTYVDRARDFVASHPNLSEKDIDIGLQNIWKSMDNRFGQMVYDNLFWKRAVRDLATGSMLSLGWNYGTWREFGGAVKDLASTAVKVKPVTNDRILFAMTYPITVGITGGLMTYALTGQPPTKLLDYFYPRTGKKNAQGNDERLAIPSMMKEFFGSAEAIRKRGPVGIAEVASHKLSPDISTIMDVIKNENFYHEEIRTPGAPLMKQAEEILEHLYKSTYPISLQSQERNKDLGALPWLGFNTAPRYITATKSQMEISDLYEKRFPPGQKSHLRAERDKDVREVRQLLEQGKDEEAADKFQSLKERGVVREKWSEFRKRSGKPVDVYMFQRMNEEDQMNLFTKMPPEEKKKYFRYLKKTLKGQVESPE